MYIWVFSGLCTALPSQKIVITDLKSEQLLHFVSAVRAQSTQCLRRRANIDPTLCQCFVFAEYMRGILIAIPVFNWAVWCSTLEKCSTYFNSVGPTPNVVSFV